MHDDRELVEERLSKLRERVAERIHSVVSPLRASAWRAPGEPVSFEEAMTAEFTTFNRGTWWGPAWSTWWIILEGQVPAAARELSLEARIDLGFVGDWAGNQSEGMVFTLGGTPLKAVNPMNRSIVLASGSLAEAARAAGEPLIAEDGTVRLVVEAACNPDLTQKIGQATPLGDRLTAGDEPLWRFGGADIVVRDEQLWGLSLDLEILDDLMRLLPETSTHRARLLRGLERAADLLDSGPLEETAPAARQCLAPLLDSGANTSAQQMTAVGHAHIDSAWLWPIRETRRKVLRTFSNVTALADQYPDFHFACTSAQHYQWLKEASAEVFGRVRAAVARGQWHVVGGMWVESDTNLPGGEALVRQFTTGLQWMESELGVRPDCLWLPDSFGYSGALPQIARLAGMRWFFTQKLSWNRTNTMPHHTFWWQGIDGTRIWTHFPPVDCYDSIVSPKEVLHAEANFKEKGRARHSLLPFGYGDGGGGPTAEMMERLHRLGDLEDAPQVTSGSPQAYIELAREEYPDAPVWVGELYLEFHRGVYTTQLTLKQGNRRTEAALHALELLASMAAETDATLYPAEALESLWQRMLLLQFHDILPGSSTAWVNREAAEEYRRIGSELGRLASGMWEELLEASAGFSVFNPAPVARREIVADDDGLRMVEIEPHAITPLDEAVISATHPVTVTATPDSVILDNGLLRVTLDHEGLVSSIFDHGADRELVPEGHRANVLRLHPDHPSCFDAWELESHYRHQGTDLTTGGAPKVLSTDPLRARVEVVREFGTSRAVQLISLDADSRSVDFQVDVDWREREHVLKVNFPLAVSAAHAAAEIQFGHVQRPVSMNTSWEQAKFEASGHRWLLLREPGYGVALSNDSTYGHDVSGLGGAEDRPEQAVSAGLTILRAPKSPDPESDLGSHRIRYSLTVDADVAEAHAAGQRLNQPLQLLSGTGSRSAPATLLDGQGFGGAVIDAVKRAFDGSGDLVVRLHEATGGHSRAKFKLSQAADGVSEVDLLEDPVVEPTQSLPGRVEAGGELPLRLRPFQILTLRFKARP